MPATHYRSARQHITKYLNFQQSVVVFRPQPTHNVNLNARDLHILHILFIIHNTNIQVLTYVLVHTV